MTQGNNQNTYLKIDISWRAIFRVAGVVLGIALLFVVWKILAALFLAVIVASALDPTLRWLEKHKVKRTVGSPVIYLLSFGAMAGIFYAILPSLFNEIWILSQDFPQKLDGFLDSMFERGAFEGTGFLLPALGEFLDNISAQLARFVPDIFAFISTIFGGIISFIVIIVFSFYLSLHKNYADKTIALITPQKYQERVKDLARKVQRRTGRWLQAMFVLATFVGVATFITLTLLGVEFALTLSIIAAVMEFIPYVGPFTAGILIVLIASTESFSTGLVALLAYVVIQQVEVWIVAPTVMSRVMGFSPVVVLISVLVGASLAGLWGIIIAVPLVAAGSEVFRWMRQKE